MEELNLLTLVPYVFATNFTPGPNNISCAASAARWGLSRTWSYIFGIVTGFFVLLVLCGLLSGALMASLPWLEKYMRWVGAAYILWLAWGIARSDSSGGLNMQGSLRGFAKGFVLQFVNPKAILYGITLYTAFLGSILSRPLPVAISAVFLAAIGFSSVFTWAVFGLGINRFLQTPAHRKIMNGCFALLLVYAAISVAGLV